MARAKTVSVLTACIVVLLGMDTARIVGWRAHRAPGPVATVRAASGAFRRLPPEDFRPWAKSEAAPPRPPPVKPRPAPRPPFSFLPFPGSAWTTPISAHPALNPNSPSIVAALTGSVPIADLYEYGVPIYIAAPSTPRVRVVCTEPWGTCLLSRQPVPIPATATPSPGSDAAMVVVDPNAGLSYEFWQAQRVSATEWQTSWGGVVPLSGRGTPGDGVGAGVSRLAGVVTLADIASGSINHALVFSTSDACSSFVYPASKSDGHLSGGACIPEGGHVQLDPSINVAAIPGLSPADRMVARALQVYGAYAVDVGGAPMAFIFEDPAGKANPYPALGLTFDYEALNGVPWNRLRVLAS